MSEHPDPSDVVQPARRRPSPTPHSRWRRLQLPRKTVVPLAILAAVLWLNAIIAHYRFNVAVALLASVPLAIVVVRRVVITRSVTAAAGRPSPH